MSIRHSLLFTLIMLTLTAASGCGLFVSGPGSRDAAKEFEDAKAARDLAKLTALCSDASLGDPDSREVPPGTTHTQMVTIEANKDVRRKACLELKAAEGDSDSGDCKTLAARYDHASAAASGSGQEHYTKWARRMAKCGNYDLVFEKLANIGDFGSAAIGVKVLKALEGDGLPVVAAFKRYAAEHKGTRFLPVEQGFQAANHLAYWLLSGKHHDHCDALASALTGANDATVANFLFYFNEAKCQAHGEKLAVEVLASSAVESRRLGCVNLGNLGSAKSLKKVEAIAQTDPYFEVHEQQGADGRVWEVKVFKVRDACKAAAGTMKARGK